MRKLTPIPAFSDNYVWFIELDEPRAVAIVDPGDAGPVAAVLRDRGLEPAAHLLTHHHGDHVGGVSELLASHPVPVYGPAGESINTVDRPVCGGDRVELPGLELEVIDLPGHTAGHIGYLGPGFALVGDTLFAGGCGRVFEGSMEQMHASLSRLAKLPPETKLYCAHEYTVANLRFALDLEPDNERVSNRLQEAVTARSEGLPTVPSTLAQELATNPFLRCEDAALVAAASARADRSLRPGTEVFAFVRQLKDGWRG
jgi:hydroxyacylglutathione hydrolase